MADIEVRTVMHIENYEDNPKMAALYALIRVLEIDPREIFYPDQDCNARRATEFTDCPVQ